jgi:hypothetical protein
VLDCHTVGARRQRQTGFLAGRRAGERGKSVANLIELERGEVTSAHADSPCSVASRPFDTPPEEGGY